MTAPYPPLPDLLFEIAAMIAEKFVPEAPLRLFGCWRQPTTAPLLPIPIGAPCYICHGPFAEQDRGRFLETHAGLLVPFHIECLILVFRGHDLGVCAHHGYAGCLNKDGSPNLREAGLAAAARLAPQGSWASSRKAPGPPS